MEITITPEQLNIIRDTAPKDKTAQEYIQFIVDKAIESWGTKEVVIANKEYIRLTKLEEASRENSLQA